VLKVDFHTHTSDDPADRIPYSTHELIERTIEGRHVLLLNFSRASESVQSFEDLAQLKESESGLVIAPHPFYPIGSALRGHATRHASLFDAVEVNAMFTRAIDFNRAAVSWAARHGKPIVGNGDIHRLEQLGTTYTLIDADRDAGEICAAVIAGRVHVEARPLTSTLAARVMFDLIASSVLPRTTSRRVTDDPLVSRS
jgi:predicted metal-dependent phosphoesterase TrpH